MILKGFTLCRCVFVCPKCCRHVNEKQNATKRFRLAVLALSSKQSLSMLLLTQGGRITIIIHAIFFSYFFKKNKQLLIFLPLSVDIKTPIKQKFAIAMGLHVDNVKANR